MQDAVQWQIIATNPAARVKPPKVQKKQAGCYDEEQIPVLLGALEDEDPKYRLMIHIALFTGLRRGKLMGLTRDGISFEKSTLEVCQIPAHERQW